jgi:hypothetical protein
VPLLPALLVIAGIGISGLRGCFLLHGHASLHSELTVILLMPMEAG